MRATYTERPDAVTVCTHDMGTDVTMRRDIQERHDPETGQVLYDCEEVQARLGYEVTAAELMADWDDWWGVVASTRPVPPMSPQEALAKLRSDLDYVAAVSGIDLGV